MLEVGDCRASGIRGCVPHLLKYQGFWCISYILEELYCIYDTPLDVLKINVYYYGGIQFPHRAVVLLPLESDGACTNLNYPSARKKVLFLV